MFDLALRLLEIRPSTHDGAAALLDYVSGAEEPTTGEDWRFPDVDENGRPFHLAMMKHVSAALRPIPAPDPIFAAIEEHRRAYAEFLSDCSDPDDKFETDDDALNVADHAAAALLAVEPNTIAGAAALLAYYADYTTEDDTYFPEDMDGDPFAAVLTRKVSRALSKIRKGDDHDRIS